DSMGLQGRSPPSRRERVPCLSARTRPRRTRSSPAPAGPSRRTVGGPTKKNDERRGSSSLPRQRRGGEASRAWGARLLCALSLASERGRFPRRLDLECGDFGSDILPVTLGTLDPGVPLLLVLVDVHGELHRLTAAPTAQLVGRHEVLLALPRCRGRAR